MICKGADLYADYDAAAGLGAALRRNESWMKDQVDLLEATLAAGDSSWDERTSARERSSRLHVSEDERRRMEICSSEKIHLIDQVDSTGRLVAVQDGIVIVASEPMREWLGRPLRHVHAELAELIEDTDDADYSRRVGIDGSSYFVFTYDSSLVSEESDEPGEADRVIELEPVEGGVDVSLPAISKAILELSDIRGGEESLQTAVRMLRELTGYDRVLGYRFFEDGHGQVVAEEHADGMESYLGLHFPASDIPMQARQLYTLKLSRMIADTEDPASGLLQNTVGKLDLSLSDLRRASSHHLQFMRNMGQRSTLTLSLTHQGELFGMITCAHRTPRRAAVAVRKHLELLARIVAEHIAAERRVARVERQLESRMTMAQIISPLYRNESLESVLQNSAEMIRSLIPSDAAVLRFEGELYAVGDLPPSARVAAAIDAIGAGLPGRGRAAGRNPGSHHHPAAR